MREIYEIKSLQKIVSNRVLPRDDNGAELRTNGKNKHVKPILWSKYGILRLIRIWLLSNLSRAHQKLSWRKSGCLEISFKLFIFILSIFVWRSRFLSNTCMCKSLYSINKSMVQNGLSHCFPQYFFISARSAIFDLNCRV